MHTHYECVNQHSILGLWGYRGACRIGWNKKVGREQGPQSLGGGSVSHICPPYTTPLHKWRSLFLEEKQESRRENLSGLLRHT